MRAVGVDLERAQRGVPSRARRLAGLDVSEVATAIIDDARDELNLSANSKLKDGIKKNKKGINNNDVSEGGTL